MKGAQRGGSGKSGLHSGFKGAEEGVCITRGMRRTHRVTLARTSLLKPFGAEAPARYQVDPALVAAELRLRLAEEHCATENTA